MASEFQANAAGKAQMEQRDAGRTAGVGTMTSSGGKPGVLGTSFLSKAGYNVVGLNVSAVPSMRAAIRTYVEGIQSRITAIDALADSESAFKSDDKSVENAVTEYVENVKEYCNNLISDLLAFSDKLADVSKAWTQFTQEQSATINSDTSASSTGTAYQESIQ